MPVVVGWRAEKEALLRTKTMGWRETARPDEGLVVDLVQGCGRVRAASKATANYSRLKKEGPGSSLYLRRLTKQDDDGSISGAWRTEVDDARPVKQAGATARRWTGTWNENGVLRSEDAAQRTRMSRLSDARVVVMAAADLEGVMETRSPDDC